LSGEAVNPTVALVRPTEEKGLAPLSSKIRSITREDTPEALFHAMHLLSKAAPCSPMASLADPAPGNVRDTVDVEAAFSVTTVNPFGRVDTEAELAFAGVGNPAGTLQGRVNNECEQE
jgi:hypothetical protein